MEVVMSMIRRALGVSASAATLGGLSVSTAMAAGLDDLAATPSGGVDIDQFLEENGGAVDPVVPVAPVAPPVVPDVQAPPLNPQDGVNLPDSDPGSVGDFIQNYSPITDASMAEAQTWLAPFMGFLSPILSGGIILITALMFVITLLDLLYIMVPFVRKALYTPNTNGAGTQMAGAGFGGMGMGGMGGMSGGGGGGGNFITRTMGSQFVSDEAVSVVSLMGGGAQAQGQGMASPFGGPMMSPQQSQEGGKGTVLVAYLKKRLIVMIVFGICIVLLFASTFTNFGANVGGMILNVINGWL